jgi:hypothetical protein
MARRQKVAKCLYETSECVIPVKHSRNILMLMRHEQKWAPRRDSSVSTVTKLRAGAESPSHFKNPRWSLPCGHLEVFL